MMTHQSSFGDCRDAYLPACVLMFKLCLPCSLFDCYSGKALSHKFEIPHKDLHKNASLINPLASEGIPKQPCLRPFPKSLISIGAPDKIAPASADFYKVGGYANVCINAFLRTSNIINTGVTSPKNLHAAYS